MKKETGGNAFPRAASDYSETSLGMSLRDYFAAQALIGYLAACASSNGRYLQREYAEEAYGMADAMLQERAK